jgi:hypothetical protein
MTITTKTLTVRLPVELYRASSEIAHRRQISLNALVQEALSAIHRAEEEDRLYAEFGLLAEDSEETSVAFALEAQDEVVRRDDI